MVSRCSKRPWRSVLRMPVRADMVNGFGTLHGGVLFAFADSAFAFSTNAGGFLSVAVDCSISFPVAVRPGDVLTATAVEQSTTNRLAFCEVNVTNQDAVTVGYFRGTVYRTTRPHVVGRPSGPHDVAVRWSCSHRAPAQHENFGSGCTMQSEGLQGAWIVDGVRTPSGTWAAH